MTRLCIAGWFGIKQDDRGSTDGIDSLELLIQAAIKLVKSNGKLDKKPSEDKLAFCSDERLYGNSGSRFFRYIQEYREFKSDSPDVEIKYVKSDDPGYEDGLVLPEIAERISVKYKGEEVLLAEYSVSDYHEEIFRSGVYARRDVQINLFTFLRSSYSEWQEFIKSEIKKEPKS
jgi:hypothetical protein